MQNLRCKNHPNENITNFCIREQCQTELCATCICQHTDMHALNGTIPHYENIIQTHKRAHELIDSQRVKIEGEKKKIVEFNQGWQKKKENIYKRILTAKKEVLELVQRTFAEIEHKYVQKVHEEEIKIGMKDGDKVMKMLQIHTNESEKLFNIQKDLASMRGPETAKILFTQTIPQNNQLLEKMRVDFKNIEGYQLNLEYHQDNLSELKNQINNLLSIHIKYPDNFVLTPLVQVIQNIPAQSTIVGAFPGQMIKTYSSGGFYERPQSVGRPIKGAVTYISGNSNGNSQLIIQNKPKISVISGKVATENLEGSRILMKPLRKSNIFTQQHRPVSQYIR